MPGATYRGHTAGEAVEILRRAHAAQLRWRRTSFAERAAKKEKQEQEQRLADDIRMDQLLDKIQKFGKASLTDEEQRFLKRVADRYKNKP